MDDLERLAEGAAFAVITLLIAASVSYLLSKKLRTSAGQILTWMAVCACFFIWFMRTSSLKVSQDLLWMACCEVMRINLR